ncbi:hypothetical protein KAFR_0H03440 [Kazachstania africana CBS 2517]|uniref:Leukotriene A(4) hydrolase n=1 Tax=Kazachstania africana (strain ATCC 22294 / BCRC 22015 / CBS 2517 / CECT 1963 / NBRC 1671 / NRRL Y-8276) TaxID=1071382 RepID=H2AYH7_KAZAF|nr:hypothetical protein KAFR_0H03440 [Kazachstania africana CBS 2517]CCF59754.1 hypothetical protein KAFR_0H03440 [Kazachstania africana CBS 2517]
MVVMHSLVVIIAGFMLWKFIKEITKPRKMLTPFLESKRPQQSPEFDYSTLSNYRAFKVNHTALNLSISFDRQTISGDVLYDLTKIAQDTKEIHLDTSFLKVSKVEIDNVSTENYQIHERKEPLGSQLTIKQEKLNNAFKLRLCFETTDKCTALQWLNAKQTSGKPYVFSQLEAIHARSLFPCFDTPSVKSTFTASIQSPLPVVFSGISTETTEENTYVFEQKVPIPAYLIGIASGDLASAPIGPRSTVYTEPFRLDDCQWEFSGDVEKFITAAEKIIFPYEWGTYDILVNVNSYPYGGMESPNMTFATPTLIAYDKSNIDVIAHELAHSWSGNLVTNCSWNHFWLNEGWTVYLERRITGAIHGEATRHFSALIGLNDLKNSIDSMKNPQRFSTLVQKLNDGTDPDEAFSSVPYEKGFNLLFYLENLLGGTEEFDPFIKHYFSKFSKKSLDTFQFLDTLFEFYPSKRQLLESVDWETWLFTPGMPPKNEFMTTLADDVFELANKWISHAGKINDAEEFARIFSVQDVSNFNSNQIVLFLETLTQGGSVADSSFDWSEHQVAAKSLLSIYNDNIVQSKNAEVVFKVFKFKISAHLSEYYQDLADWLATVGRMKFVRPGYRLLNSVDRDLALATFDKLKDTYHPICKALVKQDLDL